MPPITEENSRSGTKQNTLGTLTESMMDKYHTTDTQKLAILMQKLYKNEATILKRKYPKPTEFVSIYPLGQALADLKENGLFGELLITDETIKGDKLQFQGETYNTTEIRRVNFLASVIMQMRGMNKSDRNIMYAIVQNHNIGKEIDGIDSLHGLRGALMLDSHPERLEGFTDEEKDIIKFAIIQHSETDERNISELERLPAELRPRYKVFLDVLKDAIRLDGIEIDPIVQDVNKRIDILKISTKEHKTRLESLAYESHSKVLEILDIEEEIERIMQYLRLEKAKEQAPSIAEEDFDRD